MTRLILPFLLLWLAGCANFPAAPATAQKSHPLILVSIDGFRWDYLQKFDAPHLRALAAAGVHATRMTPCFPSKTFPNHYSLVTGLRPEHHGIVSNTFHDPALAATFVYSRSECATDPRWWQAGEPVWITAVKQDVRSACFFWPGSEAEIHGARPHYYRPFDMKLTSAQRVDGLLAWFDLPPAERPRFCTLYFDIVDTAGHRFGPDAPETAAAVKTADDAIGRLLDGLAQRGLRDTAGIVVVSDHGMTPCGPDRVIFVDDLVPASTVQVDALGSNGGFTPKTGTAAELAAQIRAKHTPHLQVYLRDEVPARLHYRDNPRISPMVLMADEGWNIENKTGWPNRQLTYNRGTHGYDPATSNMGALFLASGPAFKRGVAIGDFENIHLYNLLCAALGVAPAANDGDQRLVRQVLAR